MSGSDGGLEIVKALQGAAPSILAMRYPMGEWMWLHRLHRLSESMVSFVVASTTLVLYDHILTFGDEVERMWNIRKWWNKFIFIVNRYIVEATLMWMTYGSSPPALPFVFVSRLKLPRRSDAGAAPTFNRQREDVLLYQEP